MLLCISSDEIPFALTPKATAMLVSDKPTPPLADNYRLHFSLDFSINLLEKHISHQSLYWD
jgi:hypothetical protein